MYFINFSGRRTLHNPFQGRNRPWDPYGICNVDFSELLLGHRFLELKVPIHNCPLPDVLGMEGGNGSRLVGIAGAVDGPGEWGAVGSVHIFPLPDMLGMEGGGSSVMGLVSRG